jgi:hypothetical protein
MLDKKIYDGSAFKWDKFFCQQPCPFSRAPKMGWLSFLLFFLLKCSGGCGPDPDSLGLFI